jgi:hypothetical protein
VPRIGIPGGGTGSIDPTDTALRPITGETPAATVTRLNAALAAPLSGVRKTIRLVGDFTINGPLVVQSDTLLDATDATITLAGGSDWNMLNNAAVAATGTRDTNITIRGGHWNRGANGGTGSGLHNMRFRRVDGLTVERASYASTTGKYALSIGDATRITVRDLHGRNAYSDGVHFAGPITGAVVQNITGSFGDDVVALTPTDWTAYADVSGDITDVVIENIEATTNAAAVLIVGGATGASRRVRVRNIGGTSTNTNRGAIRVGNDNAQTNTASGAVADVTIENVTTRVAATSPVIKVDGVSMSGIRIRGVRRNDPAATAETIRVQPSVAATISSLSIADLDVTAPTTQPVVTVSNITTIGALQLSDAVVAGSSHLVNVDGTVTDLSVRNARVTGQSGYLLHFNNANAAVTRATFTGCHVQGTGGGGLVRGIAATNGLPTLNVVGCVVTGVAWIGDLGTTSDVTLSGTSYLSPGQGLFNVRATAALTVRGGGNNLTPGTADITVAAGGTVTSRTFDFSAKASRLAKVANAMAFNNEAALSCGVGPIICDGTTWKHLYTGATY